VLGDAGVEERRQIRRRQRPRRDHDRLRHGLEPLVRDAVDDRVLDRRVVDDRRLHLSRVDVLAVGDEHGVSAALDLDVAVDVDAGQGAG
jgi:hypothetical protein